MNFTLEDLLRDYPDKFGPIGSEFTVRVSEEKQGFLHIYIHPSGRNGDTLDFWVDGNKLVPLSTDMNGYKRNKKIKKIKDGLPTTDL